MTVLIAGGDSFTYGSELPSQEHTWANLLAKRKGWNICNTAKPGYSNSAIRRNVMNAVNQYKDLDLYVAVMWSFPNRYEFRFTYDTGQRESPWYSINPFTPPTFTNQKHTVNADSKGITKFVDNYVKNIAIDPYWEIYNSWCEIVMLQNYLINHNIRYVFMTVDHTIFKSQLVLDTTLKTLIADINMSKFIDQEGMFTWAKRTKQEFYTTHPKESAHIEWINMLYDRIV
jgi:hypothetical protein